MEVRQWIALGGVMMLFWGIFAPATHGFLGISFSYIQTSPVGGMFLLLIVLASLALIFLKRYLWLSVTGGAALLSVLFIFGLLHIQLGSARGFSALLRGRIQMSWGWGVLMMGAGLLMLAGLLGRKINQQ